MALNRGGQPPKPTALKLIEGNPGKRRINLDEPILEGDIPRPPPLLAGAALVHWAEVAPGLYVMGCLSKLDAAALAAACLSWETIESTTRLLNRAAEADKLTGGTIIKNGGSVMEHPALKARRAAINDYLRMAVEFGMTPAARARLANLGVFETPRIRGPQSRMQELIGGSSRA
jgi:P27 family predicted phage terminase small subunit